MLQYSIQNICMSQFQNTKSLLCNRGPDGYSLHERQLDSRWRGCFAGSTLWTQGPKVTVQPLVAINGSVFLWNGDKYSDEVCTRLLN